MRREIITACLIGLAATIGVRAADTNAPPKPPQDQRPPRPNMDNLLPPHVVDDLALTADQKTKYNALAADFKKDFDAKRESNAGSGGPPSPEARQAMRDLRKSYTDKVRGFLTDDQKTKLDQALEHARSRGPHGAGGPGGPGGAPPPSPADK